MDKAHVRLARAYFDYMNRVVVIDDEETNLKLYSAVVRRVLDEDAVAFNNPIDALRALEDLRPMLVLVDYRMPEMNGLAFITAMRAMSGHASTPIIMLTAEPDRALGERAIAAGATLFLQKPVALSDLTGHLRHYTGGSSRATHGEVVMPTDERDTMLRLYRALRVHDKELADHAVNVRDLAVALANQLHCTSDQIEALRMGGLVYDIGMLAVPRKVRESPSVLSLRWRSIVNGHVDAGASILGGGHRPLMRAAEAMARYHHERFDGSGYPDGLSGEHIPLLARILAVADTYIALVSERPHRLEFTRSNAFAQIVGERASAFDPIVVEAFKRLRDRLGEFRQSA